MAHTRSPAPTVAFVEDYCSQFRDLFADVREFEQFTLLHVGLLAEIKRKSLPRIAKTVQADAQELHHFLSKAHWSTVALRARRLELQARRARVRTHEFAAEYARRAGIEETISKVVRVHGMRRSRYVGLHAPILPMC